MAKEKLSLGIDLGTTNSECFVSVNHGPKEKIMFKEGDRFNPCMLASVVRYDGKRFIVGNSLKEDEYQFEQAWKFLKVKMKDNLSYSVDGLRCDSPFPKSITPVAFSTQILKTILSNVLNRYPSAEIENVVITVPAYFKDFERRNVIKAANDAGINPTGEFTLINEPTSAALAFGEELEEGQKVVAYDLGGGTFDVTLLDYDTFNGYRFYQAVSTSGEEIGGKNFDEKIVDIIYERYINNEGASYRGNEQFKDAFYNSFMLEAEGIKITLNNKPEVTRVKLVNYNGGRLPIKYTISGEEFYKAIDPLIDKTIETTRQVIKDNNIGCLILVGGSTKMPYLQERIKAAFSNLEVKQKEPELIVAQGALVHALTLGQSGDTSLMLNEITSNAIGISVVGDFVSPLVKKNTPIPFSTTQRYIGVVRNQKSLRSSIVVGNDLFLESPNNQIIGEIAIDDLVQTGERPIFEHSITVNKDSTIDIGVRQVAEGGKELLQKLNTSTELLQARENHFDELKQYSDNFYEDKNEHEIFEHANSVVEYFEKNDKRYPSVVAELKDVIKYKQIDKIKILAYRLQAVIDADREDR